MKSDKLVFFGHHKAGSRFFRMTILQPLAEANGYRVHAYAIRNPPFHFRQAHELDLHNIDVDAFAAPGAALLNVGNTSAELVELLASRVDFRGVHVVRDPRQVLVSGYFHHREGHQTHAPTGWVWDMLVEDREQLQRLSLEEGLLYELEHIGSDVIGDQIAAWRPRPDTIELKLEDFRDVDGYESPAMARLVDFLALPVRPQLRFSRTFGNPESQPWQDVFTPRVTSAFKERFGPLLVDLGYERDLDW